MRDQLVYNGWLKIFERYYSGKTYEVLKDQNAVSAIIVNGNNDILLVKQFRPALMKETLEIPAGTMDIDAENEIECLLREIEEEAGLDIRPDIVKPVLTYMPNVGFSSSLMKMYFIKLHDGSLKEWKIKDEDVTEAAWFSMTEIEDRISSGDILDIKTILAFWYAKGMLV